MDDNRNESIDMIRGFCVFGFGFFNTLDCLPTNSSIDLIKLLLNDIFWIMLSVIFGFGISSYFRKNENKKLFIRRVVILFILGLVNSFFIKGDILKNYAISGLIFLVILKVIDAKYIRYLPFFLLSIIAIILIFLNKDTKNLPSENVNINLFRLNFLYNWQLNFSSRFYLLFFNLSVLFLISIGYCFGINAFSIGIIKKYNFLIMAGVFLFLTATILQIKNLDLNYFLYTVLFSFLIFGNFYFLSSNFKSLKLNSISKVSLSIYIFQNIINSLLTYFDIFGQKKIYDVFLILLIVLLFPIILARVSNNNGLIFEKIYRI